jgi:hypothetical protein
MRRTAFGLLIAACVACTQADAPEYHLTKCVRVKPDSFSVSFETHRKQQRHLAFGPNGLEFSGDVKGDPSLAKVKELRLRPVLEVVFVQPESSSVRFGALSQNCQEIIRSIAGPKVRVRDEG